MLRNTFMKLALAPLLLLQVAQLPAAETSKLTKPRILVICTGNSARSQITAGVLKALDPRLDVHSGGTAPAPRINP